METPALANDKYRATLRSTWIADPADATILVDAIPTNVPTIIVVGWNTIYETVFRVEGVSGDNSSNYALTGVTRIKGANVNLPEGTAVNCLNNEEYFNQWGTQIAAVQETAEAAQAAIDGLSDSINIAGDTILLEKGLAGKSVTLVDGANIALDANLGTDFVVSAAGNRTLDAPTNPTDKQPIRIYHIASGGARTLTLATGAGGFAFGSDITEITETASGKTDVIGAIYNATLSKWLVVAYVKGY